MRTSTPCVLLLASLLHAGAACAQGQADLWYFGDHAGLDLSSGSPVPLTDSQLLTNEGCASISNNEGELLFYTDGISIWNSEHIVVNPDSPMQGHSSSSQSAIIVPRPSTSDRYFIFTQGKQYGGCSSGTSWTEVRVVGPTITILSLNNDLITCAMEPTEKLTAVCGGLNGPRYWAVTVLRSGAFHSFPVTAAGVGLGVVSPVMASPGTGGDDDVGYMKVNSQGDLLALARRSSTSISELFRFDSMTGRVTENLGTYHTGVTYGIEFSPNGEYLYATHDFHNVWQYDVNTLMGMQIHADPGLIGALQLAPDGNIYVANGYEEMNGNTLDRIALSDEAIPAYSDNFIVLPEGHSSRLGLPGLVNCLVTPDGSIGAAEIDGQAVTFSTFPDPVTDRLTVELFAPSDRHLQLLLIGQDGKVVRTAQLKRTGGRTTHDMDVRSLAAGIYLLRVEGETFSATRKVEVMK